MSRFAHLDLTQPLDVLIAVEGTLFATTKPRDDDAVVLFEAVATTLRNFLKPLSTSDLDDLLAAEDEEDLLAASLDMQPIEHDVFGFGVLERYPALTKGGKYRKSQWLVRWTGTCGETGCSNPTVFHTGSGCHRGAFCYVIDPETGTMLADLRNEYVVCDACVPGDDTYTSYVREAKLARRREDENALLRRFSAT